MERSGPFEYLKTGPRFLFEYNDSRLVCIVAPLIIKTRFKVRKQNCRSRFQFDIQIFRTQSFVEQK